MQGGYGWNSKVVGPACESVLGLEVVTADGEQIYCDPENHPDLYWAARGSGTGFFGVVTSFKLRIHRRPAVLGTCLYMYPIELVDEVYTWGRSISPEIDDRVELQILTTRAYPAAGIDTPPSPSPRQSSPNQKRKRRKPLPHLAPARSSIRR